MTTLTTTTGNHAGIGWAAGLTLAAAPAVGTALTLAECYAKSVPIQLVWNAFIDTTSFDRQVVGAIVNAVAKFGLIAWLFIAPFAAVRLWRQRPNLWSPALMAVPIVYLSLIFAADHISASLAAGLEPPMTWTTYGLDSRAIVGALLLVSLMGARRLMRGPSTQPAAAHATAPSTDMSPQA